MMRWIFLFTLSGCSWSACTPRTGYSFCATLTQVHTQNGATDSANFPVGVIGTANGAGTGAFASSTVDLRVTGSGGKIQNTVTSGGITVPADLVFTSDSAGSTLLNWEVASYTSTTGAIEAYINLSISHTTDTLFYISFGNAAVVTFQGNINGTWNANYVCVIHSDNVAITAGKVTQAVDSTSNGNSPLNAASSITQGTGVAGHDLVLSDNNSVITVLTTTNFPIGSATRTLEFWINTSNTKLPNGVNAIGGFGHCNTNDQCWGFYGSDNTYSTRNTMVLYLFGDDGLPSTDFPQDSNWHHVVAVYPSGQTQVQFGILYLDGAALSTTFTHPTNTLNTGGGIQKTFKIGDTPDTSQPIKTFAYDEWRISNAAESADWVLATYNNLHAPGSFVTVSNASSAANMPPVVY